MTIVLNSYIMLRATYRLTSLVVRTLCRNQRMVLVSTETGRVWAQVAVSDLQEANVHRVLHHQAVASVASNRQDIWLA